MSQLQLYPRHPVNTPNCFLLDCCNLIKVRQSCFPSHSAQLFYNCFKKHVSLWERFIYHPQIVDVLAAHWALVAKRFTLLQHRAVFLSWATFNHPLLDRFLSHLLGGKLDFYLEMSLENLNRRTCCSDFSISLFNPSLLLSCCSFCVRGDLVRALPWETCVPSNSGSVSAWFPLSWVLIWRTGVTWHKSFWVPYDSGLCHCCPH